MRSRYDSAARVGSSKWFRMKKESAGVIVARSASRGVSAFKGRAVMTSTGTSRDSIVLVSSLPRRRRCRIGPVQESRDPHLPQKMSSASTGAVQFGQAYSIRRPHRPQKRSSAAREAAQDGHADSADVAADFAAQSEHRMTVTPRRTTGFHVAVRRPQSMHRRSRESPASTINRSGRSAGDGTAAGSEVGSAFGGRSTARPIGRSQGKSLPYKASFEITTLLTRGATSGVSCSRYVR